MKHARRFLILSALAAFALVSLPGTALGARTDKAAVKKGAKWMAKASLKQFPGTGFRSDALQALVAAKASGASVTAKSRARFLNSVTNDANSYATTAGEAGKVVLAAVSGRKNPRCFGPAGERTDFFDVLLSEYNSSTGQFGRTAFDHALALLAFKAGHVKVPARAVRFAKSRRGQWGWAFSMAKTAGDDVESTALMIQALRASGVSAKDGGLRSAMRWITYQRNRDGGYNPNTSKVAGETQADTTAYAIQAAASMRAYPALMKRAKRALRALQQSSGAFRSQPSANSAYHGIATSNAVLALSGRHLPVARRSSAPKACV